MSHEDLIEDRRKTWQRFVVLIACSAAAIFSTLALMAIFLT